VFSSLNCAPVRLLFFLVLEYTVSCVGIYMQMNLSVFLGNGNLYYLLKCQELVQSHEPWPHMGPAYCSCGVPTYYSRGAHVGPRTIRAGPTWDPRTIQAGPTWDPRLFRRDPRVTHVLFRRDPCGTHVLFRRDSLGAHVPMYCSCGPLWDPHSI